MTVTVPIYDRSGDVVAHTLVDDCDAEMVMAQRWNLLKRRDGKYYARRNTWVDGGSRNVYLHRVLLGHSYGDSLQGDHINGDGLDNRRCNLRGTTPGQNGQNRGVQRNSKTGVRGVYLDSRRGTYYVQVQVDRKKICLGSFTNIEEAEQAAIAGRRRHMTHAPECAS